jgi:hypothetical protein
MRAFTVHLSIAIAVVAASTSAAAGATDDPPPACQVAERLVDRPSYVAFRRLEAGTLKGDRHAWMEVRTEFTPASGLTVEILAEGGAERVRKRVLRKYLEGEQQLVATGVPARAPVVAENYLCAAPVAEAGGLLRVRITPLRKAGNLVNGIMLVQPATGAAMRVHGQLAKSPSFWVSRVDVDWVYARVGGVVVPVSLTSKADVRVVGPSTFRMTYDYESINGRRVWSARRADASQ